MNNKNSRLYPDDQKKVDHYLKQGVNTTERKPFKPLALLGWLLALILALGVLSRLLGNLTIT
ncbi:MAG: DUF3094 family protein [Endozoicomonas sp. (ex Botrylloides leachii)]|nr:DUF3094 family protein [Endozoicomonas sp. (ex Botrylloides leachii)]